MIGIPCLTPRKAALFLAAVCYCCATASAAGPGRGKSLGLRSGNVDTSLETDQWPAIVRGETAGPRWVLQLAGPMNPNWQSRLAAAGVSLGEYLPEHAYVVNLDGVDRRALADLEFVRWAGSFRKSWKVDPRLGRRTFETPERRELAARGDMVVEVTLFAETSPQAASAALAAFNGAVLHWTTTVGRQAVICATVRAADAPALANLADVQFIEEAPELTLRNGTNRWIVQSNVNGYFPLYNAGIHGEGQIIGIVDTSVDRNHCEFTDTDPVGALHRKIEAYNTGFGIGSHGTHVAGICVGDAGADDNNRGVAYLGRLVYNSIPAFTEEAVKGRLETHHNQGARIHTNSWGDDGTTDYNGLARGVDLFSYENEEDLVLFAVTNTASLKNPENAKNLLAVGASQDTPSQGTLCFGGAGPTNDGRRKPEIFAPGCQTNSASAGTACLTATNSGTSMACPAVAGAGMLVRQYFTDGYYPTGAATPGNEFIPSGALIKAVLLNSAADMTGISGYPSNQEGWGRVLLDNTLHFPGEAGDLFVDDVRNADGLSTGQDHAYAFNVQSGTVLRVTLVWTDPPAALSANPASVNDLDLEMDGPLGEYKGNVFVSGQSTTGGVSDSKNNVEQIHLFAPTTGSYSIWVRATAVTDGPGNPFTQGYALVVSGDAVQAPDCNANGTADAADISVGFSDDCQVNAVPDECDIAAGTSADADANGTPDECDLIVPAATVTGASSRKLHAVRGDQDIPVNPAGRVDLDNVTSESREGGLAQLRVQFDVPLAAGVTTLAGGAVTIDQQQTGDPNAGTSAGYVPSGYSGSISTAGSVGSELVLVFAPALPNATTYRINFSEQVTAISGQSIEVRALMGDVNDSGAANATDRSVLVGAWTGGGYSIQTDVNLSGTTNALDRAIMIGAWSGPENTAP